MKKLVWFGKNLNSVNACVEDDQIEVVRVGMLSGAPFSFHETGGIEVFVNPDHVAFLDIRPYVP